MSTLFENTVSTEMLSLLKKLMKDGMFNDLRLVGGTALSLLIGHRKSIDIDLFTDKTNTKFDTNALADYLGINYRFKTLSISKLGLFGNIEGIKTDFFNHGHSWLDDAITIENIRMASLKEIAAMKLHAITGNGTRLKDFVDIAFLSNYLTTGEMVQAYTDKYQHANPVIALKAMFYYGDIDFNTPIALTSGKFIWKDFENRLDKMQKHPRKLLPKIK